MAAFLPGEPGDSPASPEADVDVTADDVGLLKLLTRRTMAARVREYKAMAKESLFWFAWWKQKLVV